MKIISSFPSVFMLVFAFFTVQAFAEDVNKRLDNLEENIKNQQKTIDALQSGTPTASQQTGGLFGGSSLANPNISVVLKTFVYSSNLNNEELGQRGIPGFTTAGIERQRGFNFEAAELFIFAPVDPYFNFYTNIPVTEEGAVLEEAYVVTTGLPEGWQLKGGKFKSTFTRLNAQHPHAWDFADIALPYRAFLGEEGLGGEKGVQLTYLPAFPVYTLMGAEALQGENDLLFGPDASSGPHAFSFFVKSSFDTSDDSTLYFGPSVLYGKTKNMNIIQDAEVAGASALYGFEAAWKWKTSSREGLTIQSEYLLLMQTGDVTDLTTNAVASLRRKQDGFYVQGIYRKGRWGIGARYDTLDLLSDTFRRGDVQENFNGKPWRGTGSLEFNPSEFTRIRLQVSHDRSDTITGRTNDEAILQFNFGIGAHAAHSF